MRLLLIILVGFIAAAAFLAGVIMLMPPFGPELEDVLWGPTALNGWMLPGLIITLLIGLAHLATFLSCLGGSKNCYRFTFYAGCLLSIWMLILLAFNSDFYSLHFIFLILGLLIVFTAYHLLGKMAY